MECNADDIGNDAASAQLLSLNTTFSSDLSVACGDVDWFRIEVEVGQSYDLIWIVSDETNTELFDRNGWVVWDYSGSSPSLLNVRFDSERVSFIATATARRFIGSIIA